MDRAAERAERLIAAFGGVSPVLAAEEALLASIVGGRAAGVVAAHRRALRWVLREDAVRRPVIATRHELIRYCHHVMSFEPVETLRVFFLDAARGLIAEEELARGEPRSLAVDPRQILTRALLLGATGLVLVHNHPSGDPTPSAADRRFTNRLAAAAGALDIRIHDHLVVARHGHELIVVSPGTANDDVIDP